ncbi:primosomal replication protein N [uncultured Azonexus sp.]|uniref:primosomal replication protein N n=1 Tax=uncultured Azonexus sp. TaxID=520307 RepID=UPI001B7F8A9D|nr:primosomal replication protein N [Azonexus hydrophilus]MBS4017741.1 primosomal replication protein N [Dechloromonas sp.]
MSGSLVERKALRYTPAGIPVSEGRLQHHSTLIENGSERQVEVEMAVLALGDAARWLEAAPLGGMMRIEGFIAARGRNSRTPVIHANTIEYLEGNENGTILQEED